MRMMNLFHRFVEPKLQPAEITWQGWNAFRRGLATNLAELGVPIEVIQKIRHGDEGTIRRFYRKTRSKRVTQAMRKLQRKVSRN